MFIPRHAGEYMTSSEAGSRMISFETYLQLALKIAKIRPETDHDACKRAFGRARQLSFPSTRAAVQLIVADDGATVPAVPPKPLPLDPPAGGSDPPVTVQREWLQHEEECHSPHSRATSARAVQEEISVATSWLGSWAGPQRRGKSQQSA